MTPGPGTLFVVSTPIGNMGDFSLRALDTLNDVALVLAEDTRRTSILLERFAIKTPVMSFHEHIEARATPPVLKRLLDGQSIALVSDAGTPLLSDPGERLVRAAIASGARVIAIPGASAVLAALVVSGLPALPFTFYGFLPRKGRERTGLLGAIARSAHTSVLYESPLRLASTLEQLLKHCGPDRHCAVARELTKKFEETRRGTLSEMSEYYHNTKVRGEVVVVLAGSDPQPVSEAESREIARGLRDGGLSRKEVVSTLVSEYGLPRNLAYRLAQET